MKKSTHGHILNLSPPLTLKPEWFARNLAYTIAKYGMSMCVLGMAEEYRKDGIAANALWPAMLVHTAAVDMIHGSGAESVSRKPEIMADAAYAILCKDPRSCTGNFFIDEDLLQAEGVTDLTEYSCVPGNEKNIQLCGFVDVNRSKL